MTARFATKDEIANWNHHILANPDGGNLFQGAELAEQKKLGNWTPRFLFIEDVAVTVLEKHVLGLGNIWYAPKGPGVSTVRELDELLPSLRELAANHHVFAVKIEPEIIKTDETLVDLLKLGLVRVSPIQPNFSTITLNIADDLDVVLARLNQKGRHAIRRAERDGVTVKHVSVSEENCQLMYNLLTETAIGAFNIRSYNYYKAFWQRYSKAGLGQLFFAYFEGQVVASAFAITFGAKSTYKDGASIRMRTAYGASHLLQWHVITWAKSKGSKLHDLCGAPPSNQINNPDHPHYGIGRFKTSFNKEVTDYIGAYDVVIKPTAYKLWTRVGERVVRRLYSYRHREDYF